MWGNGLRRGLVLTAVLAGCLVIPGAAGAATPTTTTLKCEPKEVTFTLSTTCTATVDGSGGVDPVTGTVSFTAESTPGDPAGTFSNGGVCALPAGPQTTKQCQVTYTPASPGGTDFLTASYSGDGTHDPSEGFENVITHFPDTTVTLGCNPSSIVFGATSICAATVSATVGPPVTGEVKFGSLLPGSFSGGVCTLVGGPLSKACQVTYTPATPGAPLISAWYTGDDFHFQDGAQTTLNVLPPRVAFPSAAVPDRCAALRQKLRKAKRADTTAKVRKLKRKLRRLGCQ